MKKQLLFLLITIISFNGYSQISFEKGYYINNSDQKINCLIKNLDWVNNPTKFEYKISETSESVNVNIESVKEFGIFNNSKYIRKTVKIDKSSKDIGSLNYERNPIFVEELLFLKVLIEGNTNLYLYENKNLTRFFFNKDNSDIEQLIYKNYLISNDVIGENLMYKQQLIINLQCPTIGINKIDKLEYEKNSLINFFIEYNKCNNLDFINYEEIVKKDLFNLTFRMHLNNSSLSIQNSSASRLDTDFGSKLGLGFGVEAEFILPFNQNKWAVTIEPTYRSFKSQKSFAPQIYVSGGVVTSTVNYSSIEVPLSFRHYFFLKENSKIFINASYIFDFNFNSTIEFKKADDSTYDTLEIKPRNNLGFGIGYKFKDKYGMEVRYQTSRNILGDYILWNSIEL
jgi:hypothetical protein